MIKVEKSDRLKQLPPYLFKEIDEKKEEVRARGVDIIDLGVGDPDLDTPAHIVKTLQEAATDPKNQKYPSYSGKAEFNEAVARFYKKRFDVDLDYKSQVITLIGSKEGIAHIPLAFINPGDMALVPSPAYPVYKIGTQFAGGIPYEMPLLEKNGFLPDFDAIPEDVLKKAKLMFINYPNNPTGATADEGFFLKVVDVARKNNIIVCHDAAYTEMAYDGYKPMSFLEVPGACEVGIELHSLSKTYNMTGWRLGWAAGNAQVVGALGQAKSNIDSGAFDAVQIAGITALDSDQECVREMCKIYQERRDVLLKGLSQAGLSAHSPKATFYVWINVPKGHTSKSFATLLLTEAGIVVTPGSGFGEAGEGYVRMTLTVDVDRMAEVVSRLQSVEF